VDPSDYHPLEAETGFPTSGSKTPFRDAVSRHAVRAVIHAPGDMNLEQKPAEKDRATIDVIMPSRVSFKGLSLFV
jgi:hypothetical protein